MAKLVVRKVRGGLYPADAVAEAEFSKIKPMEMIMVTWRRPRNLAHHRKYWAMLGLVHESTAISDQFPTTQKLHDAIKGALGYYTTIKLPDGKVFHKLDSIAFESMDQSSFEQFYERAVDVITDQLVPHMDRKDLAREVEAMTRQTDRGKL